MNIDFTWRTNRGGFKSDLGQLREEYLIMARQVLSGDISTFFLSAHITHSIGVYICQFLPENTHKRLCKHTKVVLL